MISKDDLKFALDNSTPYPVELTSEVLDIMADKLMAWLVIEKNPDGEVWQPEPENPPAEVESPTDVPPKPTD